LAQGDTWDRIEAMLESRKVDDALFFIDANRYLELYRIKTGKKLLAPIKELETHIFITKQVVNEVQRNKLGETAKLLAGQIDELKHAERCTAIADDTRQKIRAVNASFTAAAPETLQKVSRSEDDVSKALAELFKTAVLESDEELQRARLRKEKGNPPGKQNDPLGDQLTWEQLLNRANGKSKVWIISTDSDYCVARDSKLFLNSFLYQELAAVNTPATQVFCFNNIADGIRDFVKQTGLKAEALPTPEESREIQEEAIQIKEEIAAELIPVGWMSSNASAMNAAQAVMQHYTARQRNAAFHTMSTVQSFTPGMPPDEPREEEE
jgi:PIN domain-containing protein